MENTSSSSAISEAHFTPKFKIPSADLQAALRKLERREPSYWSYEMYRDSANNRVKVHYSTDAASSEEIVQMLKNEPVLGFAMHWLTQVSRVDYNELAGLDEDNVSVIVLASEEHICIFHLDLSLKNSAGQPIVSSLQAILENPEVIKAGKSIFRQKSNRLERSLGIQMAGIAELRELHHCLLGSRHKSNIAFADLVEHHLQLPFYSPNFLTRGDWRGPELSEAHKAYAANDAYAAYQLFREMNTQRQKLDPTPPLPKLKSQASPLNRTEGFSTSRRQPQDPTNADVFSVSGQQSRDARLENTADYSAQYPTPRDSSTRIIPRPTDTRAEEESPSKKQKTEQLTEDDDTLFRALKILRVSLKLEQGVKNDYDIAHDKALRVLARKRPVDLDGLRNSKVIGPHNIELYGERFLETIRRHISAVEHIDELTTGNRRPSERQQGMNPLEAVSNLKISARAPGNTRDETVVRQSEHKLFASLLLIRTLLAESTGLNPQAVASDRLLSDIATAFSQNNPDQSTLARSIEEWNEFSLAANSCGINVYKFMTEHPSSYSASANTQHR